MNKSELELIKSIDELILEIKNLKLIIKDKSLYL